MSAVLMCDNCGNIFSVNQEGWSEFTETISARESNPFNQGKRQRHIGPCCRITSTEVTPTIGGGPDARRIAELEKANADLKNATGV